MSGDPRFLGRCLSIPENLVIVDRRAHAIWHVQLEEIAVGLMDQGWVGFDSERGYFLEGGDA